MKKPLLSVFMLLLATGVSFGLIGRILCLRDHKDYQTLQPELFAPDAIETVLYDPDYGQIYVCYNDASYVNVYSENGTFLRAVSVPYLVNVYFTPTENKLIAYSGGEAYLYASKDGSFLEKADPDSLGLIITFVGTVGLVILRFRESRANYRIALENKRARGEKQVVTNPLARKILRYFKVVTIVQLVFSVLNVLAGIWLNGILLIGFIPLVLHFILSGVILENKLDSLWLPPEEAEILGFWKDCKFVSIAIAFLSEVVATGFVA